MSEFGGAARNAAGRAQEAVGEAAGDAKTLYASRDRDSRCAGSRRDRPRTAPRSPAPSAAAQPSGISVVIRALSDLNRAIPVPVSVTRSARFALQLPHHAWPR